MNSTDVRAKQDWDERRKSQRQQIRWKASVVDFNGSAIGPCVMVDVSATGAKLVVGEQTAVPDSFWLVFTNNGEVRRRCTVVWRTEREIGVRFGKPRPDRGA